jgi:L-fuconolactonase
MIIDAHVHLWRYATAEYPWIGENDLPIRRDFLPEHLRAAIAASGVNAAIAVQARQTLAETSWLLQLARSEPAILGVVGWLPLGENRVDALLDQLATEPALVAARHVVQEEPDESFLLRPAFARGLRALAVRGLAYDLLVRHHQLAQAVACVDAHPTLRFVLDHAAKPLCRGDRASRDAHAAWAGGIRELARRPNTWCKLSGLATEAGPGWSAAALAPWVDVLLEAFGPRRLLFGSDWPVCLLSTAHHGWVMAVRELTGRLSGPENAALFGGSAREAYRLAAHPARALETVR